MDGAAGLLLRPRLPVRLAGRRADQRGPARAAGLAADPPRRHLAAHRRPVLGDQPTSARRTWTRSSGARKRYGLQPIRWPEGWPNNTLATAMRAATFAAADRASRRLLPRRLPPGVRRRQGPERARQRPDRRRRLRAPPERAPARRSRRQSVKDRLKDATAGGDRARRDRRAHRSRWATSSSGATTGSRRPPPRSAPRGGAFASHTTERRHTPALSRRRRLGRVESEESWPPRTPPSAASTSDAKSQGALAPRQGHLPRRPEEDDADPPLRGARGRDVREGQDRRLPAPLHRRGGHGRRRHPGAARRGLPALHLPRARPGARARHAAERGHGRAVRPRGRLLGRPRRLDAPVRLRAPLPRRLRDRGRQPAAGGRRGAGLRLHARPRT